MARIRTIKPEFWTSEQVVECGFESRLLFIGLWNFADDGGVQPLSLKSLKLKIFPADTFSTNDVQKMIDELKANELVVTYKVQNVDYIKVCGWKHQKIDKPNFRYPQPSGRVPANKKEFVDQNSTNGRDQSRAVATSREESRLVACGREGNRMEGNGTIIGDVITDDFSEKDYSLANYMFDCVKAVIPLEKEPDIDKWADTIRLMRENDNLSHEHIKKVFAYANRDNFWHVHIRSPIKLRQNFAALDSCANAVNSSHSDDVATTGVII